MSETNLKRAVLVVDDEADIRSGLVKAFSKNSLEVFEADSGNKGIEIVQQRKVDLIVSDFRMSNGTGEDLLFFVRQNQKVNIPFVFMTGYSDTEEAELINKGAQLVITKPFSRQDLVQRCLKLLEP